MNRIVAAALLVFVCGVEASTAEAQATIVVQGSAEIGAPRPVAQPLPPPRRYRRHRGPRLMAPLRIDFGAIGATSDYGFLSGAELSAGVHWASLSPEPTSFDIGVGVFAGALTAPEHPGDNDDVSWGGIYGEFGRSLSGGDFWRTWASGRAEYFDSDAFGEDKRRGVGASGKLEVELYLSGIGLSPDGIFFGTYAIGLYVGGGLRRLGDDVGIGQFGAGITIRTPLVWRL